MRGALGRVVGVLHPLFAKEPFAEGRLYVCYGAFVCAISKSFMLCKFLYVDVSSLTLSSSDFPRM